MKGQAREPLAAHEHAAGGLEATLEFLKRTRGELRLLRSESPILAVGLASGDTARLEGFQELGGDLVGRLGWWTRAIGTLNRTIPCTDSNCIKSEH